MACYESACYARMCHEKYVMLRFDGPTCTITCITSARLLDDNNAPRNLLFSICDTITLFTHCRKCPNNWVVKETVLVSSGFRICWDCWNSRECWTNFTRVFMSFCSTACSSAGCSAESVQREIERGGVIGWGRKLIRCECVLIG